jgi:hypothetical protein
MWRSNSQTNPQQIVDQVLELTAGTKFQVLRQLFVDEKVNIKIYSKNYKPKVFLELELMAKPML